MRRSIWAFTLVLILLAPAAAAARIEADVSFGSSLALAGPAWVGSDRGAIDLVGPDGPSFPIEIDAGAIEGYKIIEDRFIVGELVHRQPPVNETFGPFRSGTLVIDRCLGACFLLLFSDRGGRVYVEGDLRGPLKGAAQPRSYNALITASGYEDSFYFGVELGMLQLGAFEADVVTRLGSARFGASGEVFVFVTNATGRIVSNGEEFAFEASTQNEPGILPRVGERSQRSFVVLRLSDVHWSTDAASQIFLADEATIAFDGTMSAGSVAGRVRVDGELYEMRSEPLEARGELVVDALVRRDRLAEVEHRELAAEHQLTAILSGDATYVSIDRLPIHQTEASSAIPGAVGLGALLVGFLIGGRALLLPLYSRIHPARVLANDRRRAIHDALTRHPGQTAVELARGLGIARAVVLHHLSMLRAHSLVSERRVDWERRYYLVGDTPSESDLAMRALFSDMGRRRIAHQVATCPDATSARLVSETGLSRRAVGYHLAKLESAGLVVSRGERPRRYDPSPRLAEALAAHPTEPVATD